MAKRWSEVKKLKRAQAHGRNRRRKSYAEQLVERNTRLLDELARVAKEAGYDVR